METRDIAMLGALKAHLWTIGPVLRLRLRPAPVPAGAPWSATVEDRVVGPVRLSGVLHDAPGADSVVVLVHGLGGHLDSHYVRAAAGIVVARGSAALRLCVRGADRSGEDLPHAGLTADLHAAAASEALARFRRIDFVGFSIGGHTSLLLATETEEPRVGAVAAICPPLDLAACQRHLDRPGLYLYRRHLLDGLREIHAAVAARRPVPVPPAAAAKLGTFRAFDEAIVAARHGYASADDYYARASAGPRLANLRRRALIVASEHDPLIPAESLRRHFDPLPPLLEVCWAARGGHVGFPPGTDLGLGSGGPVVAQVLDWLRRA